MNSRQAQKRGASAAHQLFDLGIWHFNRIRFKAKITSRWLDPLAEQGALIGAKDSGRGWRFDLTRRQTAPPSDDFHRLAQLLNWPGECVQIAHQFRLPDV